MGLAINNILRIAIVKWHYCENLISWNRSLVSETINKYAVVANPT